MLFPPASKYYELKGMKKIKTQLNKVPWVSSFPEESKLDGFRNFPRNFLIELLSLVNSKKACETFFKFS
jgi:hypothetical protein